MDILCFFCGYTEESVTVLFSPTTTNIDGKIIIYLVQVQGSHLTFSRLVVVRSGGEEKMHRSFYLKARKLLSLTNRCGEKSEIITSSPW